MTNRQPTPERPQPGPGLSAARRYRTPIVVALLIVAVGGLLVGLLVTGSSSGSGSGSAKAGPPAPSRAPRPAPSAPAGPEGIPLEEGTALAPISGAATGQTVDGIQCNTSEQVAYHVHTHLAVFVDGELRPLPAGIGIVSPIVEQTTDGAFDGASDCYYWLHVHAQDGVIHIESPSQQTYTLGQFFDIWGQPLSTDQIGPVSGALTVFVNGRQYEGDPRAIPLGSHESIQVDVGTPQVPPAPVDWAATSL